MVLTGNPVYDTSFFNKLVGLLVYCKTSDYLNEAMNMTDEKWNTYTKFCFIRNPYTRALSGWKHFDTIFDLKSTFSNSCEVNQSTSSSYPINTSTGLSTEKKQATSNFRFELNDLTFKKLGIQIVDLMKNTEPNLVNSITVSVNSIAEVVVQKNQELQIKLNYASVLPVQLWVRSADGEMVFLGELNFDSEGRAILPSLIFTMSGKKDLIFIQYEDVYQSFDLQFQVGKLTLNVVP
jgi:hypothetical protein